MQTGLHPFHFDVDCCSEKRRQLLVHRPLLALENVDFVTVEVWSWKGMAVLGVGSEGLGEHFLLFVFKDVSLL